GKILIAQRNADDRLAYKWEFPGGKLEADETPEQCIVRELREELSIQTECTTLVGTTVWTYQGRAPFELRAYRMRYLSGSVRLHEHAAVRWVSVEELDAYDFADADWPIVHKLMAQAAENGSS
ncbi:MAG TPA: (deoxy)nucleoside triphosphate pyrophosphohydrolase, partial [Roseiflexaceae bacterium]|nr:(deoxy)nucleoside triphosphate pyrophosphohydrolase [Roseiflexaceae bacterium]